MNKVFMSKIYFSDEDIYSLPSRILYTPSPFARTTLIHLQEIGVLKAKELHTSKRANLESYLFFIVMSGTGQFLYGGSSYHLHPGDCVFIDCLNSYSHTTDADDLWELAWIHFYGTSVPAIYEKYVSRGGKPVFHPQDATSFYQMHEKVFAVASSDDYIRDMRINSELSALLTLLMAESWNPEEIADKKKKDDLMQIRQYLDGHFEEKITLDELAEKFYINKFYLTRLFKERYGVSITTYVQQVRITKAKQMLRFTSEKIETIGQRCGIGEVNYFCRVFKKVEGITPGEYRQKW